MKIERIAAGAHGRRGQYKRALLCAGVVAMAAALGACGETAEKKPGQALAKVNDTEITVLQLNEELSRANVQAGQAEVARKKLLEALVDRQLLLDEAGKEKLDRDPKVVQAIERAKASILAQAYLQKRIGTPARPTKEEVAAYYNQNPQLFSNRKQFDIRQLVLASRDVEGELKTAIDSAKSLEEVAAWLESHKVKFARTQLSRSTTDLPAELSKRLQAMPKGQLFIIREGERSLVNTLVDVRDAPVTLEQAAPQIEQFLLNKKNQELAEAELKRLRTAAKIEYLNQPADTPAKAAPAPAAAPAANAEADANARGVAGLR